MKNLYLAILLLAFATNLSAFDKVWELQFSSAPHHVHYTEGHKELIVGEGNTFKKYNAETGALIDSVTMNFDSVLTKSIISYFITDDLKQIYALMPKAAKVKYDGDTMEVVSINLLSKTIDSTIFQLATYYGDPYNTNLGQYSFEFPGQLVQLSDSKFVYYANARLGKTLPNYFGQSGIVRFNLKYSDFSIYSSLGILNVNSFNPTLYAAGSYSESWKTGPGKQDGRTYPFQIIAKMMDSTNVNNYHDFGISNYISCLSNNNRYLYFQSYNSSSISRTDFKNIESINIGNSLKWLLPYRIEDEVLLRINDKIYHYNFKVNKLLDSIDIGTSINFSTDLNNDFLLSIGSNNVAAYKSSFKANTIVSKLEDTLFTKSTGDSITLNAISNLNPIKEEWDLGDGRTLTGDTIRFSYPKSGEYIVKYTATYKDTIVKHTCKIIILNKLMLKLDYKVEFKDGFNELTIFTNIEGDSIKITTDILHVYVGSKYTVIDSSDKKVVYKLFDCGIFRIKSSLSNPSETINKDLYIVLPIRKTNNISYEYANLNNIYNFSLYNNNLYLLNFSYTNLGCVNRGDYQNPYYDCKFNLNTQMIPISNYKYNNSVFNENLEFSNLSTYNAIKNNGDIDKFAKSYSLSNIYNQQRLLSNNSNIYIQNNAGLINLFTENGYNQYKVYSANNLYYRTFFKADSILRLLCFFQTYNQGYTRSYFSYSINTKDSIISDTVNLSSNYYDDIAVYSGAKNRLMISSVKDLKVFSIDNSFRIIDTLVTEKYNKVYSKSINGSHAFAIIDTSAKDTNQYLKVMDIKNKKSKLVKLDSTVKYHQVYQVNDSITCLMGRKDKDLVIETFKNKLLYFSAFKIEHTGMFTILEKTDDNELHLSFVDTSIPASNLIKTKGFASIFDFVSKSKDTISIPDDSTSNPIDTTKKDTTKNKGIIYIKDNQFGSVIQDPEFKAAKIYFKDSLDLSNSFVKIYTEAGTEILTYSLNKDHRELPIQTDKLYHGIYYVRLSKDGEEYNLGKFIIFK